MTPDKLHLIERIIQTQDLVVLQAVSDLLTPPDELTPAQERILETRLADQQMHPGQGQPWREVIADVRGMIKRVGG